MMFHIPILFNDDPAQIVGVGKLSESAVEMTISIQNQTFLQQIRGLAQDGLLESMSLSYSAARPVLEAKLVDVDPQLTQLEMANFSIRGHIAMCDECYRCFDMLQHDSAVLYDHGRKHGASGTVTTVLP